mgnify:FL=1
MSWGNIYNNTNWGDEKNKKSIIRPQQMDISKIEKLKRHLSTRFVQNYIKKQIDKLL